jgi:transcriptional regulator with XRE-family HTH domain
MMNKSAEMTPEEEERWTQLGRHVKELRNREHLTQKELAARASEHADVSDNQIRTIERRYNPGSRYKNKTLAGISLALGKKEDYLADYVANPQRKEDASEAPTASYQPLADANRAPTDSAVREIVTALLKEIVMPRLEKIEEQMGLRADIIHSAREKPSDDEQDPPAIA